MRRIAFAFVFLVGLCATLAQAQTDGQSQQSQTLADIRQELSVLYVEIQRLRRELSTTGAPQTAIGGASVLERVGAIEAELQRLTAQTEQLDFRVREVVRDGTNRIGDLEFRLVELEGGDVTQLGETTTLGGDAGQGNQTAVVPPPVSEPVVELAVGEQADFDAAQAALLAGDAQGAADRFVAFRAAYPASPLTAEAFLGEGQALRSLGQARDSARAFLNSFSANSAGETAPSALVGLGAMLGQLGQVDQACVTLGEVANRFPGSEEVAAAQAERTALGCL